MKKTTLLFALIAILSSCSKNEDLLPVPPNPNDPSLRTSSDQHFLYTVEEDKYSIKTSNFYQYHEDAYYLAPESNDVVTYTRYNLGGLKVANDGTGYLKSNVIPNDLTFPFRPWGSSQNYNFVFTFTMTDYTLSNDSVSFDLYYVSCINDTTFFTSTFKIVPTSTNNTIVLEQYYTCPPLYGNWWNRTISYELEKTSNGDIQILAH